MFCGAGPKSECWVKFIDGCVIGMSTYMVFMSDSKGRWRFEYIHEDEHLYLVDILTTGISCMGTPCPRNEEITRLNKNHDERLHEVKLDASISGRDNHKT